MPVNSTHNAPESCFISVLLEGALGVNFSPLSS